MAKLLEVKDMRFAYGKTEVIHGISFDIDEGEIVTLIGANGAGKSTTLNTLSGLQRISSGSITYQGKDISRESPQSLVRKGIRLVPEGRQIFPAHTVEENLLLGAYTEKNKAAIQERMEAMFEKFPRLRERRKQFGGTLSGGEQQMLAIARALMTEPKLLMLDEPSLGLAPIIVDEVLAVGDFKFQEKCKAKIAELLSDGATLLFVSHSIEQVKELCTKAIWLDGGELKAYGDTETVCAQYMSHYGG